MKEMVTSEPIQLEAQLDVAQPRPFNVSDAQIITFLAQKGYGHNDEYERLFPAIASDMGVSLQVLPRSSSITRRRGTWFYSMFDTKPTETAMASLAACLRSLVGQKTIGFLFRPGDCFIKRSFKSLFRRTLFRFVSRLRDVHILSIFPFAVSPEFSSVATNWIYDPQLWDLHYLCVPGIQNGAPMQTQFQKLGDQRLLVVAIGNQDRRKGFDYLADLWVSSPELRASHLFVACGRVSDRSKPAARQFEEAGGVLLDRRIDDAELFCLYRIADLVWSCYAPDYNQSSGIHGRAVQLGVPVTVRKGSYLDAFGKTLSHPSLALPFGEIGEATSLLLNWKPGRADPAYTETLVRRMRDHSLSVLAEALRGR